MDYVVIDDFCPEIEDVIASAYASGFGTWAPNKGEVGSSVYEGMNFWGEHSYMLRSLIAAVGRVVVPNSMFFRSTVVDTETAYVHSDRQTGNHTCVAYLTDHDEPYGTAFYKHKATGLTHMPSFEEMYEMGILDQLKKDMVERTPDAWEQVGYVEGKKNRAVIFEAPLFHSRFPVTGFGNTEEEGRLVWVSHFFMMQGNGTLY